MCIYRVSLPIKVEAGDDWFTLAVTSGLRIIESALSCRVRLSILSLPLRCGA